MAAGVRDVVVLEIRIDSTGRVSDDVRVLKPVPLLDEAAISAVKQWRYEPTQLNGVAVPVILAVSVNFKEPVADRGRARLRITLPDGGVSPEYETGLNDGIGVTLAKDGVGRFGFAASIDWSTTPSVVRVEIFDGGGITPVRLGVVEVPAGTGVVKSTTSPSFGLEIVRLDRPRSLRR
jgi:TonB family protein